MKNYKQILEAINRGIKFALDDFEDNEQIQFKVRLIVKLIINMEHQMDQMKPIIIK